MSREDSAGARRETRTAAIAHTMPFGAEIDDRGRVHFRLWAPAQKAVELRLGERQRGHAMQRSDDGWHTCTIDDAAPGTDYTFRVRAGDGHLDVPDPASRFQPDDVHGPSRVIDPRRYRWRHPEWRGRPWRDAVIYELHVGTFSESGDYAGVIGKLDYLADLGVTAIELMPLADFPGERNWGYDGVCLFAPDARYGSPEELKQLIDAAHERGLMVFLDVVYNHFGPEGNYLHAYAPQFFTDRHQTPWGAAINYDGEQSATVRDFFINNALYWLQEYRFDGLRFDAVHAIADDSDTHILSELAERVYAAVDGEREVHLMLENDENEARFLRPERQVRPSGYVAQWNDDIHHAMHVLLTGEHGGYYADYSDDPIAHLGRCLTEGFAYQGDPSRYRDGAPRGESTDGLPPTAFIAFMQNHDQVGNRAFGDRIASITEPAALRALTALLMLSPPPPMLFMGQEWGSKTPFLFFCDFGPELSQKVTEGRRREFGRFPEFADPEHQARIPDPSAMKTFADSRLHWSDLTTEDGRAWLELHRQLLAARHRVIAPRLGGMLPNASGWKRLGERALQVNWVLADNARLTLLANLGSDPVDHVDEPGGEPLFAVPDWPEARSGRLELPGWSVAAYLFAR
jgi:maltooligosyltrehalose trehalohydrolase